MGLIWFLNSSHEIMPSNLEHKSSDIIDIRRAEDT